MYLIKDNHDLLRQFRKHQAIFSGEIMQNVSNSHLMMVLYLAWSESLTRQLYFSFERMFIALKGYSRF